MTTATEHGYLTVIEIAKRYRFGPDTVLRWIKNGVRVRGLPNRVKLKAMSFGKWYRVHLEDLEAFLKEINPHLDTLREEDERAEAASSAARRRVQKRLGIG